MYKATGRIIDIMETVQISDKFQKREFVIETNTDMYPQKVLFQSVQDKTSMLDAYAIGDDVEVSFNLRGREWTSPQNEIKYFNTLDAWRIEKTGNGPTNGGQPPRGPEDLAHKDANDDDLPF